jgi:PTH1 family peptidyl-tRNA hydrolase
MKLIVGLGNPGPKYDGTRHNIGFMVVRKLADEAGIALKRQGHQGIYGVGRCGKEEATLLLPQTFMNLSGASVCSASQSLGIAPGDLIVIHDDIDLPFGRLRIRRNGGHGGHNGLRSIAATLGTDFYRIKVGVGRPMTPDGDVAAHVLSSFSSLEKKQLDTVISAACAVIVTLINQGEAQAMNDFNNRELL